MAEWNPWQEMEQVRRDIDRAFEQVGGRQMEMGAMAAPFRRPFYLAVPRGRIRWSM